MSDDNFFNTKAMIIDHCFDCKHFFKEGEACWHMVRQFEVPGLTTIALCEACAELELARQQKQKETPKDDK